MLPTANQPSREKSELNFFETYLEQIEEDINEHPMRQRYSRPVVVHLLRRDIRNPKGNAVFFQLYANFLQRDFTAKPYYYLLILGTEQPSI